MTTAEHIHPQSTAPELRDRYGNCIYSCTYCNTIRQDAPLMGPEGQRLLDPTRDAWGDHFELRVDATSGALHLEPRSGDLNAIYTAKTYHLNDPPKGAMRHRRLRRVEKLLTNLEALSRDLACLEAVAQQNPPTQDSAIAAERAGRTSEMLLDTLEELMSRWRATPGDAPRACRCGAMLELPVHLAAPRVLVEYDTSKLGAISVSRPGSGTRAK